MCFAIRGLTRFRHWVTRWKAALRGQSIAEIPTAISIDMAANVRDSASAETPS
jgi:hypothetical protein